MRERLNLYVFVERLDYAEVTVLQIEAIRNAESRFQIVTKHRQVREQESTEIDQNALAFRMWQTLDLRDAQD